MYVTVVSKCHACTYLPLTCSYHDLKADIMIESVDAQSVMCRCISKFVFVLQIFCKYDFIIMMNE